MAYTSVSCCGLGAMTAPQAWSTPIRFRMPAMNPTGGGDAYSTAGSTFPWIYVFAGGLVLAAGILSYKKGYFGRH